jgi:hypothetical protein
VTRSIRLGLTELEPLVMLDEMGKPLEDAIVMIILR